MTSGGSVVVVVVGAGGGGAVVEALLGGGSGEPARVEVGGLDSGAAAVVVQAARTRLSAATRVVKRDGRRTPPE